MSGTASFELTKLTTSNPLGFVPANRQAVPYHFAACPPAQSSSRTHQTRKKRDSQVHMLPAQLAQPANRSVLFLSQGGDQKKISFTTHHPTLRRSGSPRPCIVGAGVDVVRCGGPCGRPSPEATSSPLSVPLTNIVPCDHPTSSRPHPSPAKENAA